MFWDATSADQWQATQDAAATLGLRVAGIELRDPPYDYERAFAQSPPDHRGELLVMTSTFFFRDRAQLAELVLRHRVVSMFGTREWADAGGLVSYGTSGAELNRRAAEFTYIRGWINYYGHFYRTRLRPTLQRIEDRLAKGAKPSDLPIEQPTTFELIINLKTAKAIGVTVPWSLLLRADEVIEC